MKNTPSSFAILFGLLASLFLVFSVSAQDVELDGFTATVVEADDYFTDVGGEARDFDDICDIGFDHFAFRSRSVSNGIWTGVAGQVGPKIGIGTVTHPNALRAHREDCGELTAHNAIDTNKYSLVSFRSANDSPDQWGVLWDKQLGFSVDGIFRQEIIGEGGKVLPDPGEFTIKSVDLDGFGNSNLNNVWGSGFATGLTLWPNVSLPKGETLSLDWVRLTDPDTGTNHTLSWTTTGFSFSHESVAVYIDTDQSGFDGEMLANGLAVDGSYEFNTAILPPGTYYFYLQYERDHGGSVDSSILDYSSYRGPLVVNGKPRVKITSPSRMTGAEYSRDELGNPWDMSDSADILNLDASYNPFLPESLVNGLHDEKFENGLFIAESDLDTVVGTGTTVGGEVDTNIVLNVPADKPIRTNIYRYFCTRLQIDPTTIPRDGDPSKLNIAALVSRVVWDRISGDVGLTRDWELTEAEFIFPNSDRGMATYCIDLWDDTHTYLTGTRYREHDTIFRLRYDPIEAINPTKFAIDWVGLYAENYTNSSKQFEITYELEDVEGDSMNVSFFYDNDFFGQDGTLIGTSTKLGNGSHSFTWNANGVPDGTYYIYVVVDDGNSNSSIYSKVPIHVTGAPVVPASRVVKAPCDFDGDGKTDRTVVRHHPESNSALWITSNNGKNSNEVRLWGDLNSDYFLAGDTVGDRMSGPVAVRTRDVTSLVWMKLDYPSLLPDFQYWGEGGDVPLLADFDGDGKDDYTVFRPSDGSWWAVQSSDGAESMNWGATGDLPTPADYDGDQKDDLAVWRPSDGTWWIVLSSGGTVSKQWGLPGDHPMTGDYTGDGKADLAVWRPTSAIWYICRSDDNFDCSSGTAKQWGLPGDHPIKGDFDGDAVMDYTTFRPSDGIWYTQSSKSAAVMTEHWGQFGDLPLCMGVADEMAFLGL